MSIKLIRDEKAHSLATNIVTELKHLLLIHSQTCVNCEHFDEKMEICKLANQRPPARVIAFGCNRYSEEIPF